MVWIFKIPISRFEMFGPISMSCQYRGFVILPCHYILSCYPLEWWKISQEREENTLYIISRVNSSV